MLLSVRKFDSPSLGARMEEFSILHPRFRVFHKRMYGMASDDAFFGRLRPLAQERSHVVVVLSGEVGVRATDGTHLLRPGDCRTQVRNRPWGMRIQVPSEYLLVEWEAPSLGTRLVEAGIQGKLSRRTLQAIRAALGGELTQGGPTSTSERLATILELLRAEGLPFEAWRGGDFRQPEPDWALALSRAVDATISCLQDKPRLVDLQRALGWSDRQIQRRLQEFQQRYACHPTRGWRELQRWWRLPIGAYLMAMPGNRTEDVAEALGYGTPAAFCQAFANAGLPSPGSVRGIMRAL